MEHHGLYRILLVDDDPLILAGMKQLIERESRRCVIAGTASSVDDALKKLKLLRPDIVICDIIMPGATGIDLLKQTNTEFPDTVFIMLSNYSEFNLAQEALHYHAAEYLVKANLKNETVKKALDRAIEECEKRNKLHKTDEWFQARQQQAYLRNALRRFLCDDQPLPPEDTALLHKQGMLSHFAFAFIPLNFTVLPEYAEMSMEKQQDIFDWETEITARLAASFFPNTLLLPHRRGGVPEGVNDEVPSDDKVSGRSLLLFVWGIPAKTWEADIPRFRERLVKTSGQITRLGVDVAASTFYLSSNMAKQEESPAQAFKRMEEEYYRTGKGIHSDTVQKALQYILTNIEKRIMLQDVADFVCISPGYLSTLFKREYHQNLMDFVNQVKVDRACELLRENKYRINEIAYMLGFDNAYYFSRIFRRYAGVSPSEFRTGTET